MRIPFKKVFEEQMKNPEFEREFHDLGEEFELAIEMIKARKEANLTQTELAEKMGTTQVQVSRLESGKGNLTSLRKYAKAVGRKVKISLTP
ncbi:MAG: helix-turn-helix domain-containing protein [Synergistaceae bacterium]|jgi:ribosome-binding protein aMBF1 (putative translation factor)|nr:helix-turn-helix domain-containing protein [Synergistaceae bacterium]